MGAELNALYLFFMRPSPPFLHPGATIVPTLQMRGAQRRCQWPKTTQLGKGQSQHLIRFFWLQSCCAWPGMGGSSAGLGQASPECENPGLVGLGEADAVVVVARISVRIPALEKPLG